MIEINKLSQNKKDVHNPISRRDFLRLGLGTLFVEIGSKLTFLENITVSAQSTDESEIFNQEIKGIILKHLDNSIIDTNLNPNETILIQKFEPSRGGEYFEDAYRLIDSVGEKGLKHPKSNLPLYVRGGDRVGIEAMNFDFVYDSEGKIVGLVDDVEGQAVIRNYHTYPPQKDFWGAAVIFDEEYIPIEGVEGIEAILEANFDFYVWARKDEYFENQDPKELIRRRAYIIKDSQHSTHRLIALSSFDENGYQRTLHYDTSNYYWWSKFQEAKQTL